MILVGMGFLLLLPSCQDNDLAALPLNQPDVPNGYVAVSFNASVPDMTEVQTRAVDPDGMLVHNNMTLFCFNEAGLYMTRVKATFPDNYVNAEAGTFTAVIPKETHVIHFVANQNDEIYANMNLVGLTEDQMHATMVGASGMMIYWARFECTSNGGSIDEQLKAFCGTNTANGSIQLIRNHAKLSLGDDKEYWNNNIYFTVTGFVATNIRAFGTTAPYHPYNGFPTCNHENFGTNGYWWASTEFVTLPEKLEYRAMMSDIEQVDTKDADYLFEHENTNENPISVIIRGKNKNAESGASDLYYRVMLTDSNGEFIRIRRNHWYKINITGPLTHGQATFKEALVAPPSNNVWIAVEDWVNTISNNDYSLSVSETSKVVDDSKKGQFLEFTYTVKSLGTSSLSNEDKAVVSWMNENNVANYAIEHAFTPSGKTGTGTIRIQLVSSMPENVSQLSGTLLVEKGNLQRKIEIVMIKTMKFSPSWVSAQVYSNQSGENVTLKFTIPEDCPKSLFPFPVLITVNDLDVRHASGQKLPIRLKGQDGWFGADGLGYKYEYMVENPGVHRLFFTTVLPHHDINSSNTTAETEPITLEANFFETLTKQVLFTQVNNVIQLPLAGTDGVEYGFNAFVNKGEVYNPEYQTDEPIFYLLVPQKKNAEVNFQVNLMERSAEKDDQGYYTYSTLQSSPDDEFLLYSKSLSLVSSSGDYTVGNESTKDENGHYFPFFPEGTADGKFVLKTTTKVAKSADVVRIASNNRGYESVKNSSNTYSAGEYRSAIFELGNYRPFRFAAKVAYKNSLDEEVSVGDWAKIKDAPAEAEDPEDEVSFTYEPNQQVDISFEVTSFQGGDNKSVDPFGTEFKVYIDAPMLEIDESRRDGLTTDKFYEEPEGRFVYVVNASREQEKDGNWCGDVLIKDIDYLTAGYGNEDNVSYTGSSQTGERKTLPFLKKDIAVNGDIVLSSDENVVFYKKTFKVKTEKISGDITYGTNGTETAVPALSFVSFARKYNGTRVGSLTITEDGMFSLNLRSEYEFTWEEDMEIDYVDEDGNLYECTTTLQDLYSSKTIQLKTPITQP